MTSYKKIGQVTITFAILLGLGIAVAMIQWNYQKHKILSERVERYRQEISQQQATLQKLLAETKRSIERSRVALEGNLTPSESDEAQASLEKAQKLLTQGWLGFAQAQKTLKSCKERLKDDPNNELLLGTIAQIYKELGNYSQSVRYYNKTISLMSKDDPRRSRYVEELTDVVNTMGLAGKTLPLRDKVAGEDLSSEGEGVVQ